MNRTEYLESRKISNKLAKLIRQGLATEDQIAEYEKRDVQEKTFCALPLRKVEHRNGEASWFIR